MSPADVARSIAVVGPKGGVGTTFVAVNLAIGLRRLTGRRVQLVDFAQPSRGDIAIHLALKNAPDRMAAPSGTRVQASILGRLGVAHESGVMVLSMPPGPLGADVPPLGTDLWLKIAAAADITVVDVGAAMGQAAVEALDAAHRILLVAVPEVQAVSQARRALDGLQQLRFPRERISVVLNRTREGEAIAPDIVARAVQREIVATIPDHPDAVSQSILRGAPLITTQPRHPISLAFDRLVVGLTGRRDTPRRAPGSLLATVREAGRRGLARLDGAEAAAVVTPPPAPQPPAGGAALEQQIVELKLRIHRRLVDELGLKKLDASSPDPVKRQELRALAERKIGALLDTEGPFVTSRALRQRLVKEMLDEALGLGPLEDLLADPEVSEIMVNGPARIWVERHGKIGPVATRFIGSEQLMAVIERIVAPLGRRIDEKSPMVDARLRDGSRVNAVIPPLALEGPVLTIRKFTRETLDGQRLIALGTLVSQMVDFLSAAVRVRQNILISGGTGSGKTSLLNVLSAFIPPDERIVTVEDSAELRLAQPHVVPLEARPPNIEGQGEIAIRDLVRNALRMRPDRIVVGECRGGEALDMLQAMNTGHDGSLTTIHANSSADALSHLETLALMGGVDLPSRTIRDQISAAIDLIVQVERLPDGTRKVVEIAELAGRQGDGFRVEPVFVFRQTGVGADRQVLGRFTATGHVPAFTLELERRGIVLPREIFWDTALV